LLIDAGQGDQVTVASAREPAGAGRLDAALSAAGTTPDEIDIVLATHLHAESAGGFTVADTRGVRRPRFPKARYLVRRGEWEDAMRARDDIRGAYARDSLLPLERAGVLDFMDDDGVVMPGVRVQCTGGHTRHHQIVWVESQGLRAVYPGDLIPTFAHAKEERIMGIDLYPMATLTAKRVLMNEAISTGALVCFGRDPSIASGYLGEPDGHPTRRHTP
jgi:glyoxylase-like metal-dependent hydrolase (beta-lactamase superfamily II)